MDRARVVVVLLRALPSIVVAVLGSIPETFDAPSWFILYGGVALLGGAVLSLVTTPIAVFITWKARGRVSPRTQKVLWWICAAALIAPALIVLQMAALQDLS